MRIEHLVAILLLAAPLNAQTSPSDGQETLTPRQALQKVELQAAQGHRFSPQEIQALDPLREALVSAGDTNRAAELDLLKLSSMASAKAEDERAKAKKTLADDADQWDVRERMVRDQNFWRGVRDVGLLTFTASTTATLLLAAVNDRNQALLSGRNFSDLDSRNAFNNGMQWAMTGTAATMFLSLFPLLWGEARQ